MSFINSYYNNWDLWELRHKVTFDGANRLILVNEGETSLDVGIDLYSDWKEWSRLRSHTMFLPAISVIGGEPVGGGQYVGATYFLENGWRIKPYEGNYVLDVIGNLYTREAGQNPVVPTSGVSANFTRSTVVTIGTAPSTDLSQVLADTAILKSTTSSTDTKVDSVSSAITTLQNTGDSTMAKLLEVWKILGLDATNPQVVTDASITVGDITISIAQPDANTTTATRQ